LLLSKVPVLKTILEDILENADDIILKEDITKLLLFLQEQQSKERFGSWIIPQQTEIANRDGCSELL
jgi:hypothetical protein